MFSVVLVFFSVLRLQIYVIFLICQYPCVAVAGDLNTGLQVRITLCEGKIEDSIRAISLRKLLKLYYGDAGAA